MQVTLAELAQFLGGEVVGDGQTVCPGYCSP